MFIVADGMGGHQAGDYASRYAIETFLDYIRHTENRNLIRVMDEDATRGSALSRALYAYLLNFMDLKKAAQQLGIHRNTLEYQVRKMNAVIGKPPDGSKRFRMMCTYKMLALPDTGVHDV